MIRREEIREFNKLESQNNGTTNTNLKEIHEDLLMYLPLLTGYQKRSV